MALPAAVKQLGLIPGLIMIVLGAMLTESSIDMIMRFTRASKTASYSGLVGDAFGGPGRTLLQLCVVVNNLGMLVVYMIIIGIVSAKQYFLFLISGVYLFFWYRVFGQRGSDYPSLAAKRRRLCPSLYFGKGLILEFWCCRGCAVRDLVGRSAPFGCNGGMVWSTLVDRTVLVASSHHAPCFGSSYFFQARGYILYFSLSLSVFFFLLIITYFDKL